MNNSKILEIAIEAVNGTTSIDVLYNLAEDDVYTIEDIMCVEAVYKTLTGSFKFIGIEDDKEVFEVSVSTMEIVNVFKPLENDEYYCDF